MPDTNNELSGKIGADVTDFKAAISTATRELRLLESGFRASAATLGDWSKDATGLELRIRSLTSQIDVQRGKVAALEAEYRRVAAEKGANSRAAQDLEIKLNKENETLGKMQVELDQDQTALAGMGKESDQAAKETETLARSEDKASGSTKTLGERMRDLGSKLQDSSEKIRNFAAGVAKAAVGIAVGLAAAVGAAAVGIGALVLKTAAAADELVELSDKTGISTTRLQELAYIGEQTGTSVDTVTGSLAKLVRSMDAASKAGSPAAKAFKELGVNVRDANGNLRDNQDVFNDVLDALGKIENPTERDALAMEIFGKSAQELNPLIKLGAAGMAEMADEAHRMGGIMSEEAVQAAAALNDKLAGLKAGLGGIGARLAGAFIPLITKVADKFKDWLSSPAVQQGIDTLVRALTILGDAIGSLLSGNLNDAFTKFGAFGTILAKLFGASGKDANKFGLGIVNALKSAAKGIGSVFEGIGKSIGPVKDFLTKLATTVGTFITGQLIPFIQQHGPAIKGALAAIGIALGVVAVVVPIVAAVIAALTSPITLIVAAAALLGAAWATNWGGIRDKTAAVWAWLQPILLQIWTWLQTNIPKAVQAVSDWFNNTLVPALRRFGNFITTQVVPVLQEIWNWLATNVPQAITTLKGYWDGLVTNVTTVYNFFANNLIPKLNDLGTLIGVTLGGIIQTFIDLLTGKTSLHDAITKIWGIVSDNLNPILTTLGGIFDTVLPGPIKDFIKDVLGKLKEAFNGIKETIEGIIKTVGDWIDKLIEAAKHIPHIFQPGSPTPFEVGLRGIAKATQMATAAQASMTKTLREMGKAGESLALAGAGAGGFAPMAGAGASGGVNITINATMTSNMDIPFLARQVAEVFKQNSR
jgi:predicted  nucleic acid-binding Zn-ribbon protein